ncbi:MAG: DUF5106 domain-containing protein [Bacteroidales bacterium]|nr:DUF5106 domain-containing protein [Bacteroidales bacterium]
MPNIIITLLFVFAYIFAIPSQKIFAYTTNGQTYFEYPKVPDNLETLTERSNFFIEHFWDRCNIKSAFSSRAKITEAFNDYVSFMPYADANVVHTSINNLIKEVSKNPKNLLTLAEIAEGTLYADTARIACDECYLPFAQAVVDNRKISKAEKARFEYQANALAASQVGMPAPELIYTRPDGTEGKLSDLAKGAYVLLFFNDPDCTECELARVRLSADSNLNDLVSSGKIIVLSIYPGEPDDEWRDKTSVYNSRWEVGAVPDADEFYDMRNPPVIYYLNNEHTILSKTFDIDNLIEAFRQVNAKMSKGN